MSLPFDPLGPRTLRHREVRQEPLRLLDLPHVQPLNDYARRLRAERPDTVIPHFDPFDGGTAARVLFLVGPGAARAEPLLKRENWRVFESYHPSPKVKAAWASKWLAIPDEWAKVMEGR